ncbi:DnaJ subfamily C member 21-like protein [Operophtera brumata]|uniref:DnaJ homolog subfamily C member 21 n=1 Tax=Operophtera brumata TaxID=104452 RepID=A0A0L7KXP4_OPEBR|nr:DnaJ subfamily C member 21-like protein [Operophtera brumata]
MKCHYEVLCIEKEASASDIKKAYRRLALQWHPDKNLDNLVEAKEQFQLVQNAYEVLSDPQERAWYDNHREQLLRGAGSSYNDDSLDVYQYFSPSCYKGFGEDPQSFYSVYAEVFSKLAAEETDFLDDPEEVEKIPKFGNSTTIYEEQNDNRRVIKLMEKENNKIRQKARKERNEEIRRLVSFVRRRDRRVHEHAKLLQEKAEANKIKAEQVRRERIMQRQKEIAEAKKKEGESSFLQSEDYQKKLSEIESLLAEEFGLSSDDDTISEGGMESSNEESSKTEEVSV